MTYDSVCGTHNFLIASCIQFIVALDTPRSFCPNFIRVATTRSFHQAKLEVNRAPKFNRRLAESRNTDNYFNKVIRRKKLYRVNPGPIHAGCILAGNPQQLQFAPEMVAPQHLRGLASCWLKRSSRFSSVQVFMMLAIAEHEHFQWILSVSKLDQPSEASKPGRLNACER